MVSVIGLIVYCVVSLRERNFDNTQFKKNIEQSREHLKIFDTPDFDTSRLLDNIFMNENKTSNKIRSAQSSDFTIEVSHRNSAPDAEIPSGNSDTYSRTKRSEK